MVGVVVPDSVLGVVALVALVVPGVLYASVRVWAGGFRWTDHTVSARLFEAVLVSIALDAAYLVVAGPELMRVASDPRAALLREPAEVGRWILVLGVLVPVALGCALHVRLRWWRPPLRVLRVRGLRWVRVPVGRTTAYESVPTAWDKVAPRMRDTWVRVQLPDGRRVGGWISVASFASTYPRSRDIYIQEQFEVLPDGTFGAKIDGTRGVWLSVPDHSVVEWIEKAAPRAEEEEP
ncbi:hypothetical protein C5E08_12380 [Rathayibacter iranicus]|uniref:Uncharacterized protein n=1 Tax=Rathayibacter iranicus TaxID=59737 RepID=A0AAD1EMY8_9MICO|nr:hypothetical protein C7V51_12545 [Rathayibacter iranicus]PPI43376.1 hypothetical protein C5E09_11470 [Rathayibacter iranicus]PPI58468.1 hypothetical protein C5E08_12380 [Rathayibacter iranicus]PPI69479.1 hypothetical protein C5E01_11430 [Rathayibacter iranicus]